MGLPPDIGNDISAVFPTPWDFAGFSHQRDFAVFRLEGIGPDLRPKGARLFLTQGKALGKPLE